MVQQEDIVTTTQVLEQAGTLSADSAVPQRQPLTPARVLSWLPPGATPAQQDSAIQAHFKPSEIRWSKRPDTLHLPGHDKGHNLLDINIPQYYREGFFSKDTLFHPELPGGRIGVAGDPVPYSLRGDNILTSLLLACFILAVIAFSSSRNFVVRQFKSFFYMPHEGTTEVTETAGELRFQVFLVLLTCIELALLFHAYATDNIGDVYVFETQYHLIVLFFAITVAYFIAKWLLYSVVNSVFFDGKRNRQWLQTLLFITAVEGVLVFPVLAFQAYFNLSLENVEVYFTVVLIIVKFLTIYRAYVIFFRQNAWKFQIILYFCTLEIVPLLALWVALVFTANSLKINI